MEFKEIITNARYWSNFVAGSLLCACGACSEWANHILLTEVSTGVLWVLTGTRVMLHPGKVVSHQSASSCSAVVVLSLSCVRGDWDALCSDTRRKWDIPTAPAMPCKKVNSRHGGTRCRKADRKATSACILEADESKRLRVERILRKNYEDHVTGKGSNSLHHYILVHKNIPLPQAMKIPAAEAAVDFLTFLSAWSDSVSDAIIQSIWWSAKRIGKKLRKFRRGIWQKPEINQKWSMKQGIRT